MADHRAREMQAFQAKLKTLRSRARRAGQSQSTMDATCRAISAALTEMEKVEPRQALIVGNEFERIGRDYRRRADLDAEQLVAELYFYGIGRLSMLGPDPRP